MLHELNAFHCHLTLLKAQCKKRHKERCQARILVSSSNRSLCDSSSTFSPAEGAMTTKMRILNIYVHLSSWSEFLFGCWGLPRIDWIWHTCYWDRVEYCHFLKQIWTYVPSHVALILDYTFLDVVVTNCIWIEIACDCWNHTQIIIIHWQLCKCSLTFMIIIITIQHVIGYFWSI